MAIIGMDVAEVRMLSQQLNSSAQDITRIVQQLTSKLGSTTWVGNDRNKFESDWQSQHVANLNRVAQALTDAGTLASQNADQQEQASNS
jgi:uncharacterized protein YukE